MARKHTGYDDVESNEFNEASSPDCEFTDDGFVHIVRDGVRVALYVGECSDAQMEKRFRVVLDQLGLKRTKEGI